MAFLIRLQQLAVHLFNTSSRFINWLVSIVRAAKAAGSSAGSGFRSPIARNFSASLGNLA